MKITGILQKRYEYLFLQWTDPLALHSVFHHANNRHPYGTLLWIAKSKSLPDGIFTGPIFARHVTVNDRYAGSIQCVSIPNIPPAQNRNMHRLKVSREHRPIDGDRRITRMIQCVAFNMERQAPFIAGKREVIDAAYGFNPGHSSHTV